MSLEEEKNQNQDHSQEQNKDSKLSSKDDSINKKMQEMYEERKKENPTSQRPQSKYHRDRLSSGKHEKKEVEEKLLIEKINNHLTKNQITKKEFSDNQNVFMPIDELSDLFKNIHLDLSPEEIQFLFDNNNPNKNDGYIYFNTLLDNYNFEFYPGESTMLNKSNKNETSNSNYTSLLLNKQEKMNPTIKNEFSAFKNDILNIVEESNKPKTAKRRLPPLQKKEKPEAPPKSSKDDRRTQRKSQSALKSVQSNNSKKPKINYLKQTLQRQMLEEEMIKLTIDKRDKEFQRDCVKKMVLANEYVEQLGLSESYSAYSEEGDNVIMCRIFSKNSKDFKDVNLKQFLIEFRKLEKLINQKKEREKYKHSEEIKHSSNKEGDFFKMDRDEKHKIIKKILKESIQLKMQLKKQLKALRDKKLIDLDTINKNLKLTNLDDDTIL